MKMTDQCQIMKFIITIQHLRSYDHMALHKSVYYYRAAWNADAV